MATRTPGSEPTEPSGAMHGDERDGGAWLALLTDAVELLLRHTERQLDQEVQAAFTAGQASTVQLRQLERDQVRQYREQLHRLAAAQAAVDDVPRRS